MESRFNPGVRVIINRIRRKSVSDCDVGHGAWRHGRRPWSIKATDWSNTEVWRRGTEKQEALLDNGY